MCGVVVQVQEAIISVINGPIVATVPKAILLGVYVGHASMAVAAAVSMLENPMRVAAETGAPAGLRRRLMCNMPAQGCKGALTASQTLSSPLVPSSST